MAVCGAACPVLGHRGCLFKSPSAPNKPPRRTCSSEVEGCCAARALPSFPARAKSSPAQGRSCLNNLDNDLQQWFRRRYDCIKDLVLNPAKPPYTTQMEAWMDAFPREQVHVVQVGGRVGGSAGFACWWLLRLRSSCVFACCMPATHVPSVRIHYLGPVQSLGPLQPCAV